MMGKNNMKMTHKAKNNSGKNQKPSNSKPLAGKGNSKNSHKPVAKGPKKDFDFKKKSGFTQSNKENKGFKDKKVAAAAPAKKSHFSAVPVKSQKKEVKIEVSSFKKEHLKKLEQKKRDQEKHHELKKREHDKHVEVKTAHKPKEHKESKETKEVKEDKKIASKPQHEVAEVKVAKKQEVKAAPAAAPVKENKKSKSTKPKEKDEEELDDAFLSDDESSEIEEYAEDLKAVEEADIEVEETEVFEAEVKEKNFEEINLTDAEGNLLCRSRDCDQVATVEGYCRYHYLLFWKKIQVRKKILTDGKLERYVEELTSRYPDKFLEMIRRDLRTQKDFLSAIQELEIDESNLENDFEEDTQTYIDEVRGINETTSIDEEFE